jgi:hypothetical protein
MALLVPLCANKTQELTIVNSTRERIFELRFRIVHDLLIRGYSFLKCRKAGKITGK